MKKLEKIFKTDTSVIGMIHFLPLIGYKGYGDMHEVLSAALLDLRALEMGGVGGILIENNYDLPHRIIVGSETVAAMTYLAAEIAKKTKLPIGISVLWNDYKAALFIAKVAGAQFIRVPVFVDNVRTSCGDIFGNAKDVTAYRKKIGAKDILLFTDIHVKHATLLSTYTVEESACLAKQKGSDGIIITGKWTADAPLKEDLARVRRSVGKFPILIGSGATARNINELMEYANGVIVGTSLKTGKNTKKHVNIKGEDQRIDHIKVKTFVKAFENAARKRL